MTTETQTLYQEALKARALYNTGAISRKKAESIIKPYVLAFNLKSKEIAKKYSVRAKLISFAAFIR